VILSPDRLEAVRNAAPECVRRDVSLAPFSAYKVGGPADLFAEPRDAGEAGALLREAKRQGVPVTVIGAATNLLIRDGGVRGLILRLGRPFREVRVEGTRIVTGALASMTKVALAAERASLAGITFGFDIPGTVGGALRMNAGAHGGEIRDVLVEVRGLDEVGREQRIPAERIEFGYRRAVYPVNLVFLEATFALQPGDRTELERIRQENHAFRLRTQPKGRSVGSVFKNPDGDYAGRLIEEAGLKGLRVGGAEVSTKHANWILNVDRATAAEIESIIRTVQERVRERFDVELRPEVKIVGEPEREAAR
jgi:UDP-N-acetylmuramate dehydrogenase